MPLISDHSKEAPRIKVLLWALPRGASTAFYKSLTANGDMKAYFEPFAFAEHHGPEGHASKEHQRAGEKILLEPKYTFDTVKKWLDAEEGRNVFVKDFAYTIEGRYHLIPANYKHSFLIRKPESVFKSFYRIFQQMDCNKEQMLKRWLPDKNLFKCSSDLADYLESDLHQDIVIIDADDVIKNPAEMVRKYCKQVGLVYNEGLLTWDKGIPQNCPESGRTMEEQYKWMANVINSTGWGMGIKKTVQSREARNDEEFPPIIRDLIQEATPYYNKMRNHPNCLHLD